MKKHSAKSRLKITLQSNWPELFKNDNATKNQTKRNKAEEIIKEH